MQCTIDLTVTVEVDREEDAPLGVELADAIADVLPDWYFVKADDERYRFVSIAPVARKVGP